MVAIIGNSVTLRLSYDFASTTFTVTSISPTGSGNPNVGDRFVIGALQLDWVSSTTSNSNFDVVVDGPATSSLFVDASNPSVTFTAGTSPHRLGATFSVTKQDGAQGRLEMANSAGAGAKVILLPRKSGKDQPGSDVRPPVAEQAMARRPVKSQDY